MIGREARLFRVGLQLLTRLPAGRIEAFEPGIIERAAKYFPAVGVLTGFASAFVLIAAAAVFPEPLPVVLALVAGILVTGALHEDGLADAADGLFGGSTTERRLEIMKDSRTGTFGVLALIAVLAIDAAALSAIGPVSAARVLIVGHASAQAAAAVAMWALPYVRCSATSKLGLIARGVSLPEAGIACAIAVAVSLLLVQPGTFLAGAVLGSAAAAALALMSRRRIGGYTGDVLGAIVKVFNAAFAAGAAAVIAGPG